MKEQYLCKSPVSFFRTAFNLKYDCLFQKNNRYNIVSLFLKTIEKIKKILVNNNPVCFKNGLLAIFSLFSRIF